MSELTTMQLKRLQTLYSQVAAGDALAKTREQRLMWAGLVANRAIASFSELTEDEAKTCIERLQAALNERQPAVKRSYRRRKKMRTQIADRERAARHGKDGRHDSTFAEQPQLAGRYDLDVIEGYVARLGWSRAQFDGWLGSARSPLKPRAASPEPQAEAAQIRTVAEANRVRWALVKMLKGRKLWAA